MISSLILKIGNQLFRFVPKLNLILPNLIQKNVLSYLKELGVSQSGLERVIKKAYDTLGLQSYYTAESKKSGLGRFKRGVLLPKLPLPSILILRKLLLWPKSFPIQILSPVTVLLVPKKPANFVMKVEITLCVPTTLSNSKSMFNVGTGHHACSFIGRHFVSQND
jgi:hypothetical protein